MAGIQLGSGEPNLRGVVRELCFEYASDTGLFSTPQVLDNFINLAHRRLYREISRLAPSHLAKRSADVVTSSSVPGKFDMGGVLLDANGVVDVVAVEYKDRSGNYAELKDIHYTEGRWPGIGGTTQGVQDVTHYAFLGQAVMAYPEPQAPVTLRITYVPGVGLLSNDTDMPYGGNLQQFHELVAYLGAFIALSKDRAPEYIKTLYADELEAMRAHLRRTTQRSRHVLMVDPDNRDDDDT